MVAGDDDDDNEEEEEEEEEEEGVMEVEPVGKESRRGPRISRAKPPVARYLFLVFHF